MGVDVFFVISGYLITGIILKGIEDSNFSFREFYSRRIKRLFPALSLILIGCYVAGWMGMAADEFQELGKHIGTGAGFVANFNYANEIDYFDKEIEYKPLITLWTLSLEEQFYILWPLILTFATRLRLNLKALTAVLLMVMFFISWTVHRELPLESYYLPQSRFWELLSGCLLAMIVRDWKPKEESFISHFFSVSGIFLILGGMLLSLRPSPVQLVVPVLGSAFMILAGPQALVNRHFLSLSPMVKVGLISYCIYLWHWPLLSLSKIILNFEPQTSHRLLFAAITFVLSALTYRFIEMPVRRSKHSLVPVVLFGTVTIVGVLGFVTYSTELISPLPRNHNASGKLGLFDESVRRDPFAPGKLYLDRRVAMRQWDCHMSRKGESFEEYLSGHGKCLNLDFRKPTILIIGDSYSADLYGSLMRTHPEYEFLQFTGAGCYSPTKSEKCGKFINYAIQFALKNPVDAVMFAGYWDGQQSYPFETAKKLRKAGKKVIISGPPPLFEKNPYHFLVKRRGENDLQEVVRKFITADRIELNERMKSIALNNALPFLDELKSFCVRPDTCEVLSDKGELLFIDTSHLSVPGMDYLGRKLQADGALKHILESKE